MEERVSQAERRVFGEAQKKSDLELGELRERLEAVRQVRPPRQEPAGCWARPRPSMPSPTDELGGFDLSSCRSAPHSMPATDQDPPRTKAMPRSLPHSFSRAPPFSLRGRHRDPTDSQAGRDDRSGLVGPDTSRATTKLMLDRYASCPLLPRRETPERPRLGTTWLPWKSYGCAPPPSSET